MFRGAFPSTSKTGINHTLYFPSYSLDEFSEGIEWGSRHFVVMVAGNKYWNHNRSFIRYFVAKLRNIIMRRKSYITNEIKQWQLHDKRLELIEYFGKKQGFNLFGGNWNDISNLPKVWRRRLGKIIDNLNPTTCDDKHEILLNYKFAICLENIAYPGYVTEKIIDCFKAGVIPIYLGAPDIYDFVPSDAFIDLREYENCDGLYEYLSEISEDKAMEIIQKGRSFLSSSAGHEFSYEVFAKHVIDMANQHG